MRRFLTAPWLRTVVLGLSFCPYTACSNPEATTTTDPDPAPVDPDPAATERIEGFLDELQNRGFSGVVAVERAGFIQTRPMGLADREAMEPILDDTVFDVGSVTKQITAAAILRLEMDGQLRVEDRLGDHLPGLPAEKANITLHQLLTHTGGLPPALGFDEDPIERGDFLALVSSSELAAQPGQGHLYSNVGYSLLAMVVETASGQPYEDYLQSSLFSPAQMMHTGYRSPAWPPQTVAVGYAEDERFGRPNEQPWASDGPGWHLRGNGGLLSTAGDMLRWHRALLSDDILSEAAKAKYYAPHTPEGPEGDTFYGYGWALFPTTFGTTLITHNGGNGVFFADFLRFLDEDVAIFIVTNAAQPEFDVVAYELADQVFGTDAVDPGISGVGQEGVDCGLDSLDDLEAFEPLPMLPTTDAGTTAELLVTLLLEGADFDALVEFAEQHVTAELAEAVGLPDPESLALGLTQIQTELAGQTVRQRYSESDLAFHFGLTGGEQDAVLSISLSEVEPSKVACFGLTY